jgi:hypothetical protein
MPILQNPRHEAFAQARAKGALLDDAYEDAGFVPERGNACRLAKRPEVAARIAELRADNSALGDFNRQGMIASLLRIAKASEDHSSPAGVKETRLTLLEAWRLAGEFSKDREHERYIADVNKF